MAATVPARSDGDWAVQTADTIERVVVTVRSKTADPVVGIARWVVFGLLAAFVGSMALVLLAVVMIRVLDVYLPKDVFGVHHVWLAYFIAGAVFSLIGFALFAKARPRPVDREA